MNDQPRRRSVNHGENRCPVGGKLLGLPFSHARRTGIVRAAHVYVVILTGALAEVRQQNTATIGGYVLGEGDAEPRKIAHVRIAVKRTLDVGRAVVPRDQRFAVLGDVLENHTTRRAEHPLLGAAGCAGPDGVITRRTGGRVPDLVAVRRPRQPPQAFPRPGDRLFDAFAIDNHDGAAVVVLHRPIEKGDPIAGWRYARPSDFAFRLEEHRADWELEARLRPDDMHGGNAAVRRTPVREDHMLQYWTRRSPEQRHASQRGIFHADPRPPRVDSHQHLRVGRHREKSGGRQRQRRCARELEPRHQEPCVPFAVSRAIDNGPSVRCEPCRFDDRVLEGQLTEQGRLK